MKIHEVKMVNINDLKVDGDNPNIMTTAQEKALEESMNRFGYLTPIIIDQDNVIADGEHRLNIYKKFGIDKIPAIQIDMSTGDRKLLRQILNKLKGEHDPSLDAEEFKKLIEAGMQEDLKIFIQKSDEEILTIINKTEDINIEDKDYYTHKIQAPQYTPSNTKPKLNDLYNKIKTQELVNKINNLNISEEEKEFLIATAQRFIEFRYDKIADYYAHSNENIQKIMEELALVIIDFNDAINSGFIRICQDLANKYQESI